MKRRYGVSVCVQVPQWRVLLIEAGPNEPTGSQIPAFIASFMGSSIDWKYKTEPEEMACLGSKDRRCYWPRGKVTIVLALNTNVSSNIVNYG